MKKIGFFIRGDFYEWGLYQTERFADALQRKGLEVEIYGMPSHPLREVFERKEQDLPDLTCSLMDLREDKTIDFTLPLEHRGIPHLLYAVDCSYYYFKYLLRPLGIVTTLDFEDLHLLKQDRIDRTFYLPLACEADIPHNLSGEKLYPVSYIGTFWDYESEVKLWQKQLGKKISAMMLEACEATLGGMSQIQALDAVLKANGLSNHEVPFCAMHRQISMYVKGKERLSLIQAIHHVPVHVFGTNHLQTSWEKALKNQKNVIFHGPVSFQESLKVMRQSQILLNGAPQFRYGLHDRIFNGLASGALVMTDSNPLVEKSFAIGEELLTYQAGQLEAVDETLQAALANPKRWQEIVSAGREKVLKHHTWDQRADTFCSEVPKIMEAMKREPAPL